MQQRILLNGVGTVGVARHRAQSATDTVADRRLRELADAHHVFRIFSKRRVAAGQAVAGRKADEAPVVDVGQDKIALLGQGLTRKQAQQDDGK